MVSLYLHYLRPTLRSFTTRHPFQQILLESVFWIGESVSSNRKKGSKNHQVNSFCCLFSGLNQCKLLSCSAGQECSIDKQGITSCVCPEYCEPIVRPICASNGRTYSNLCLMQREACLKQTSITAKYYGTCGKSNNPFVSLVGSFI